MSDPLDGPPGTAGASSPPPRPSPPPSLPDHSPPRVASRGCTTLITAGCGGFIVLSLVLLAFLYWQFGYFVVQLEMNYIRGVLSRSGRSAAEAKQIDQVLADYDEAAGDSGLGFSGWQRAGRAFARSPSGLVLGLLDARASLGSQSGLEAGEAKEAQDVLERLMRGASEGKVNAEDIEGLVERARSGGDPPPGEARPVEMANLGQEELRRFVAEAKTLADRQALPTGPYSPDLPGMLRRDLWASLEAGRKE